MEIILASASPRRRELFKYIASDFKAVSLDIDETILADIAPDKASEYLALLKARAAAEKFPDDLFCKRNNLQEYLPKDLSPLRLYRFSFL